MNSFAQRTRTNVGVEAAHGKPVNPSAGKLRPLGIDEVVIEGGFWGHRQALNAKSMLRHIETWVEKMGWVENFEAAVEGRLPRDRRGREFSDSDVYKLIEAMAWEFGRTHDEDVDRRLRALVDRIAPAQEPDGYLNTMFGRPGQAPRYSDFQWGHELYCFGHLIQAGVARLRTHGHDLLVDIALRAADHVCETFGEDGVVGICGHPEIEVALVELSRATGERRYLEQARRFVERRGHGLLGDIEFGRVYFQDDIAVRDAAVLSGHAVRALYLAAGSIDVAVELSDDELLAAVRNQVTTTLDRRTYLTGGMGSRHDAESFGDDFELPPDRAYSETCAGVGSIMANQRLLLATGDVVHADAIERVLYNVVAASPAADGQAFFYTNTLHQRVAGATPDKHSASPRAAAGMRAAWFNVSCCPPNVARTFAALGSYIATVDQAGLQLQQYAPTTIRTTLPSGQEVGLQVSTNYPSDGKISVRILTGAQQPWTLSFRVPSWARAGADLVVDGESRRVEPGYVSVTRAFQTDEVIELQLPVRARWSWADRRIDALRAQVAVERGPIVMCMESIEPAESVNDVSVLVDDAPIEQGGQVLVRAVRHKEVSDGWPYAAEPATVSADEPELVPLLPYHDWGNRGPSTMRVWLPTTTQ